MNKNHSSRIKLVCFDLNKTLIEENTWFELNKAMGVTEEEDEFLYKIWEEGFITYSEWQDILTRMYRKRGNPTRSNILKIVSNYTYKKGAKEIIKYLQSKNYEIALISAAMDMLIEKCTKELNIKYFAANNRFIFDDKNVLTKMECSSNEASQKLENLEAICRKIGISITECACVGDGDNDKELFKTTKHGVTFKGSKLEPIAWETINNLYDLRLIF